MAKFNTNVTDSCDFCGLHTENSLSLFFTCDHTQHFWAGVCNYFLDFTIPFPMSRLQILFGVLDEPFDSHKNTAIMIGKLVIWACKFKKIIPNINFYKRSLRDYLVLLRYCHIMKNTINVFNDQWGEVFLNLAGEDGPQLQDPVDPGHGQLEQGLPMQDLLRQRQQPDNVPPALQHSLLQQADGDQGGHEAPVLFL